MSTKLAKLKLDKLLRSLYNNSMEKSKVVKISGDHYKQIEELANTAGMSMHEAADFLLGGGAKELEKVANHVANALPELEKKGITLTEDDLLGIANKNGKTNRGEGEQAESDETGNQGTKGGWLWIAGALLAVYLFQKRMSSTVTR